MPNSNLLPFENPTLKVQCIKAHNSPIARREAFYKIKNKLLKILCFKIEFDIRKPINLYILLEC